MLGYHTPKQSNTLNSTKTFENLEERQKFRKLLNFRNTNHLTENSRNSEKKVEWKENFREIFFSKILVYLARLFSFLEILENTVSFATGSCRKFKPDVLVEWKAPSVSRFCWVSKNVTCKSKWSSLAVFFSVRIYLALGFISVYTVPGFEIILYLERGISMMERAKWTVNGI